MHTLIMWDCMYADNPSPHLLLWIDAAKLEEKGLDIKWGEYLMIARQCEPTSMPHRDCRFAVLCLSIETAASLCYV